MSLTPGPDSPASPFDPAADGSSLKQRSVRGGMWLATARGGTHVVRLGATLILARLLAPEDFGLVALIVSTIGIASVFQDMGLSVAAIQRKGLNEEQASTLFWLNVGFGALLGLICVAAAPLIALFYGDERALGVTMALAISFLINGLGTQHIAILRRRMRFAQVARLQVISVAASSSVVLALGYHDAGYWALVGFLLTGDCVTSALAWHYSRWRPGRTRFDRSTREMLSFGGYMVGFAVLGFFGRNVHNLLIGRMHGMAEVGLFSRAYALMLVMKGYTCDAPNTVALSALSRLVDEPARYRLYYLKCLRITVLAAAPLGVFATMYPADLIAVLFGGQWGRSADVLQWLAPAVAIQPVIFSSGWLFLSRGKPRDMMLWGMFGWTLTIVCIVIGAQFDLEGIAIGYTASIALLIPPCMAYATRGTLISLGDVLRAWWPGTGAALLAGAGMQLLPNFAAEWPTYFRLVTMMTLFGSAYLALTMSLFGQRRLVMELLRQIRPNRKASLP